MATFVLERMGDADGRGSLIKRVGFFGVSHWTKQMRDDEISPDGEILCYGGPSPFDRWVNTKTGKAVWYNNGFKEIEQFYRAIYSLKGGPNAKD